MSTPDRLSETALDWARAHLTRFGDTDIFPVPFEFQAIWHGWSGLSHDLTAIDLNEYRTRAAQSVLVPKASTGFRASVQPDPLDALLYSAMIYEAADALERHRAPAKLGVACSFRLQPSAEGSLFEAHSGGPAYHRTSLDLAKSGRFTHVLTADISDFYNQVSHQRVMNVLESAGVPQARAANIGAFLSSLSAAHSRGLPVGPSPSVALAEASLDDVDKFLLSRGLASTRYVDDFRVFCVSERQAVDAMHALWEYLHRAHGLVLTHSKTRLYSVERFVERELTDPAGEQQGSRVSSLKDAVLALRAYAQAFAMDDLPAVRETRESLLELFAGALAASPMRVGLVRYLLRRARQLRATGLRRLVLGNLRRLAPAMREVVDYLSATAGPKDHEVAAAMLSHLKDNPVGGLPFVRLWGLQLFANVPFSDRYTAAAELAEESRDRLGIRPLALLAHAYRQVDWVRSQKDRWASLEPWDRRAVIHAAAILPAGEKQKWCALVKSTAADPLDRVVAEWTGARDHFAVQA